MQIRQSLLATSMAAMMAATPIASAEEVSCANPMSAQEQQAHIQNMQNMSEQDRELYRDRQYEILRERVREMGCPELPQTPPWKTVAKTAPPAPAAQQPPSAADQEAMIEERRAETEKAMESRRAEIQKQMEARQAELLPVDYYHVVFTLPAPIAALAYQNKTVIYAILFRAAAQTLLTVGAAFNFHAGVLSQAPRGFQDRGLEWLYRLMAEKYFLSSTSRSCGRLSKKNMKRRTLLFSLLKTSSGLGVDITQ